MVVHHYALLPAEFRRFLASAHRCELIGLYCVTDLPLGTIYIYIFVYRFKGFGSTHFLFTLSLTYLD